MKKKLKRIYAKVPQIDCRGLCHRSCGPIPVSKAEVKSIGKVPTCDHWLRCEFLDLNHLCSIYEKRPLICRLFGVVKKLRCPYGCEPERWLSDGEAAELIRETGEA